MRDITDELKDAAKLIKQGFLKREEIKALVEKAGPRGYVSADGMIYKIKKVKVGRTIIPPYTKKILYVYGIVGAKGKGTQGGKRGKRKTTQSGRKA